MIFNSNTTSLGATTIPMAEGYDASCGVGLALVESARNDYSMFKAMIQADYKELAICKESTGVVMEGEVSALHEAVGAGIVKKIVELFKKLVAKIKSIFHNFAARLQGLFGKDKDLVKKYQTEVLRKSNIGKLEVKWRKKNEKFDSVAFDLVEPTAFDGYAKAKEDKDIAGWDDDAWKRAQFFLKDHGLEGCESTNEVVTEFVNKMFAEEDTVALGDVGGVRAVCDFLSGYSKKFTAMQSNINKSTANLEKIVKTYNDKADAVAKSANDKNVGRTEDGKLMSINQANHIYDMAVAYQTVMLAIMQATMDCAKLDYKQNKAAFMKAITVSEKKLEESTILNAIAEEAEENVEDVLAGALDKEEISDLSAASTDVKDSDVSDDANELTGGVPDKYSDDADMSDAEGEKDVDIQGSCEENAFFGKMFY